MKLNVENAMLLLEEKLKESNHKKYKHSIGVAKIAAQLARKWRVNVEEAVIAALLHDIGKSMKREEMLDFCSANGISISEFERFDNQEALHGKISAHFFKEAFREGEDGERTNKRTLRKIARAIESHIAGRKNMSLLDKIIFLADNLESKKYGAEMLEQILADKRKRPGFYIGKIIDIKIAKAVENVRFPNPGLQDTISSGPEGNPRRERFAKAIKNIARAKEEKSGGETKITEPVVIVLPTAEEVVK